MNCPNCGAPLEGDAKFCMTCGARLNQDGAGAAPAFSPGGVAGGTGSAGPKNDMLGLGREKLKGMELSRLIGLIVGTVLIIVGISRITGAGSSISSTSFGADFYTYAYQGIVAISRQLAELQVSLGWVIVAIGAAIDVRALRH